MPHREAELVALCSVCKERADDMCLRCDRPLCGDHEPADEERCDACESDFKVKLATLPKPAELSAKRVATEQAIGSLATGIFGGVLGTVAAASATASVLGALKGGVIGFVTLGIMGAVVMSWRWGKELGSLAQNRIAKRIRKRARRKFLEERAPKQLPAPSE